MHEIKLSDSVIARAQRRRGDIHPFGEFDPARTALLVVDMQNGFVDPEISISVPMAPEIVPNINRIADSLRRAGGKVVWIQMAMGAAEADNWANWFDAFAQPDLRRALIEALTEGSPGFALWPACAAREDDLWVVKNRFSAFIQGSSDIDEILKAHDIDTLLITGTVTNVCCESTARDAAMLNYKVIMVSDGNAARSDEEHNATLNNLFNLFTDVLSSDQIIARLEAVSDQPDQPDQPARPARRASNG
jgi:ureidoacrylate peracid hydrolase